MNPPDTKQPELTDAEGERFLADLDAALARKAAPAEHPHAAELRLALRAASELPASGARASRAALPAASRRSSFAMWLAAAALIAFAAGCFFTLLLNRPQDNQAIVKPEDRSSVAEDPEKEKPEEKKEDETPESKPKAGLSKEDRAVMEKLAKKVTFEFVDVPLNEILTYLHAQTGADIVFDSVLGADGSGGLPVSLKLSDAPASVALDWIGRLTNFEYVISHGVVFVSNHRRIEQLVYSEVHLETYELGDLSVEPGQVTAAARSLLFGPPVENKNLTLTEHGGKLVAMLNAPLHAELSALLQGLHAKGDWPPQQPKEPWETRIQKALDEKRVEFEFVEVPLAEALAFLASASGVNIVLDAETRAASPPISLRMGKNPLRTSLDYIVALADQKYTLENEAVYVASAKKIKPANELRIYDIRALVKGATEEAQRKGETTIAALVKTTLRQGNWDDKQGTTVVELGDRLVVRNTPDVQALVKTLLEKLAVKQ